MDLWITYFPNGLEAYAVPLGSLLLGSFLFVMAPTIIGWASPSRGRELQVTILRISIFAFVGLQLADLTLHQALEDSYNRLMYKVGGTLLITFVTIIAFNLLSLFLSKKLGFTKEIDGETVAVTSYHSRLANIVIGVVLFVFAILAVVQVWDLTSLTERTGFIGAIAAFIIFTNSVWFPDVYFGIVLLWSLMAEEGDTIQLEPDGETFIVYRITPFFCLLLNVNTNARVIMRNSHMFKSQIENLTKRAASEGLRQYVDLNLSYPADAKSDEAKQPDLLFQTFDKAVAAAFLKVGDLPNSCVNEKKPFEWVVSEAGDFALTFRVHFYIAALPETKLTKKIRSYLVQAPADAVRLLYQECAARGLHLATPVLVRTSDAPPRGAAIATGKKAS